MAAAVGCALWLVLAGCTGEVPKPEKGRPAPDFALPALDGSRVQLSDLRGKVVFVNLWATWCPPCRKEMPSMVELYRRFRGRGLEILAVSQDRDVEALRAFVGRFRLPFPVLLDTDKRVYGLYRATGVPETHLIDKEGRLQASVIGPFDWTDPGVVAKVEALLAR
ncbi:MAG: TlpA disulfide reductase family protein [Deferrisomatales bacterium]